MSPLHGPLIQTGFIVANLDAAIEHWLARGVGPFFEMHHVPLPKQVFRGEPTNVDMSIAIAYSGSVQVELIHQHNDAPSLYREHLEATGGGMHHLGFLTSDYDAALAWSKAEGQGLAQESTNEMGGRFGYLERDPSAGVYVELIEAQPALKGLFGMIEKASRGWDGEKPRRVLGG